MMKVQFANGKVYDADNIDHAVKLCLADGHDPFKPKAVIEIYIEKNKKPKIEETIEDENREQY